jgi:hypothetical protein
MKRISDAQGNAAQQPGIAEGTEGEHRAVHGAGATQDSRSGPAGCPRTPRSGPGSGAGHRESRPRATAGVAEVVVDGKARQGIARPRSTTRCRNSALMICASAGPRGGTSSRPRSLRSIISGMVSSTESRRLTHRICTGSRTKRAEKSGTAGRHQHRAHDQQGLRGIGRQGVEDRFLQVVPGVAPLLHGGDNRGEVVVFQHHIGGLLGHLRAAPPHGHTDIRGLQRRRIVDAVAGHGHHVAIGLAGPRRSPSCAPAPRGRRPRPLDVSRSSARRASLSSAPVRARRRPEYRAGAPRPGPCPGDRR